MADNNIALNIAANDEHVPKIERHIRTLKERMRATLFMLPFNTLPPRLIIKLAYYATFWLNSFPAAGGVSSMLSPRTIITGEGINYQAHCSLKFGEYV
jgi:hypothetical protein